MDTDGDGLLDNEDECVKTPGPKERKGVPDKDADTIADNKDNCPDIKIRINPILIKTVMATFVMRILMATV